MNELGTILLISPEPWDAHFVSKHHYAIVAAKYGHRVYFLNPPCLGCRMRIRPTDYEGVWEADAPPVAKGLRFLPKKVRLFLQRRWLEEFEKYIGESISTVWLFENSRFYDMAFANSRLKIYHQVDLNQDFHPKEAASSADICIATNTAIARRLRDFRKDILIVPHAAAMHLKSHALSEEEVKRFSTSSKNAVLVGNLDIPYLDRILLEKTIRRFDSVRFHLVGGYDPRSETYERLKRYPNIVWWGRVRAEKIPEILRRADLLTVCYKSADRHFEAQLATPHKIPEYLASGKPVVATYMEGYRDIEGLIEMTRTPEAFLERFETVINDLPRYQDAPLQAQRIAYARQNSYEKAFERIVSYLRDMQIEGM